MATKWIAVVNRIEARIFQADDMTKIYTLKNSLGREKNRAFTTDKPGTDRNRSHSKSSTHGLTGEKQPHDEAAKKFAHKIYRYLHKRFLEHQFEELMIVAEPRMRGWVKEQMDKNLLSRIEWKSKDLGKMSDHAIKILFLGKEAVWPRPASSQSNF